MATKNTTLEENRFLHRTYEDFAKFGKTEKKCPRCGNEIEINEIGNSYTIKCKTKDCISAGLRGI